MNLSAGTKLGPYEIVSPIGAGGMGEVWKARDTRLDRSVAVKVSAAQFSERFEREARAVAALNHPHICTLHDVGPDYLVMEYVDGKPLAGPLPIDQGLRYAIQIAEALDAAHRRGIVHRDLKPANILVARSGIKLLDFGLAKLTHEDKTSDATMTQPLTRDNAILGTLQYMAPEQLQGKEADARSDIFSFGCVLYEMFTGTRAFEGTNAASVITAVMSTQPPPLTALLPVPPAALDHLIATCLAKDPEERCQNIHDALLELRWLAGVSGQAAVPVAAAPPRSRRPLLALAGVAAGFALTTLILGWVHWREAPAEAPVVRFGVEAPPRSTFSPTRFGVGEISPDGLHLVLVTGAMSTINGGGKLWIRRLDSTEPHLLAGTDGATYPFWSGDSRHIGFFAEGKLKRVAVDGGPPQTICAAPNGRGGTWHGGADGVIVFAAGNQEGLSRVAAGGGEPVPITALDPGQHEISHRVPHFLPDGRRFLFVAYSDEPEKSRVMAGELPTAAANPAPGAAKRLLSGDTEARWASPGYLLLVRDRNLIARPFDAARLEFTGEAAPVAEGVDTGGNRNTAAFSVSTTGVLTYHRRFDSALRMVWLDRQGKEVEPVPAGDNMGGARLSPDGRIAAGTKVGTNGYADLWLLDLVRSTASRFTFDPKAELSPAWSPDGKRIAYSLERGPGFDVYMKDAGGLGEPELLVHSPSTKLVSDWSPDGKWILYSEQAPGNAGNVDIKAVPVSGDRKPVDVVASTFRSSGGQLSPDGRFLAYGSDESGRGEVYVRTFVPGSPAAGGKWQISNGGGFAAQWRRDGKELFYVADNKLMAVAVQTGATFQAGTPAALFEVSSGVTPRPDGQRFLMAVRTQEQAQEPQQVVLNWATPLAKRK